MNEIKQKKINHAVWFFVSLIVVYEIAELIIVFTGVLRNADAKLNIIISQSLIFIPTIVYLVINKENPCELLRLRKTHWLMVIIVPIIAFALLPLTTIINAISMLFVDNRIVDVSNSMVGNHSYGMSLLLMAVLPAVVEETAYRGVILGSFVEGSRLTAVIMSGVLFGVMHMNFNQMAYAIVLGIIFAFMLEATGSILSTMLAHFCINGVSVSLNYIVNKMPAFNEQMESTVMTKSDIGRVIAVYAPFAVVGTLVAACLIVVLALLNNRKEYFLDLFRRKKKPQGESSVRIVTPLLVIVLAVCLAICAIEEFILK